MEGVGLVLEGGGMRGVYTGGVLDGMMEAGLRIPYVIGVSAGACNGISYVSEQKGRNKKVTVDMIRDPRYLSFQNWIREGNLFGVQFVYHEIPKKLIPFDYDKFYSSTVQFKVAVTNCETGQPAYFCQKDYSDRPLQFNEYIRASASLPFFARIVEVEGEKFLDGGLTDPVPIGKSIEDGNKRNVIVLTRNAGYIKEPSKSHILAKKVYKKYPQLSKVLKRRHEQYNETMQYIHELEENDRAFVIRPAVPMNVNRIERNQGKLAEMYKQGYIEFMNVKKQLVDWLQKA